MKINYPISHRVISVMAVLMVPAIQGCSTQADLTNVKPELITMSGEGFSVMVAGELKPGFITADQIKTGKENILVTPTEDEKRLKSQLASQTRIYQNKQSDGEYCVSITDCPPHIPLTEQVLIGGCNGAVRAVNGKETLRKNVRCGVYDGMQVEADLPTMNGAFRARIFVAPDRHRLYQVAAIGKKPWVDAPNQVQFVNSFAVLPASQPAPH